MCNYSYSDINKLWSCMESYVNWLCPLVMNLCFCKWTTSIKDKRPAPVIHTYYRIGVYYTNHDIECLEIVMHEAQLLLSWCINTKKMLTTCTIRSCACACTHWDCFALFIFSLRYTCTQSINQPNGNHQSGLRNNIQHSTVTSSTDCQLSRK